MLGEVLSALSRMLSSHAAPAAAPTAAPVAAPATDKDRAPHEVLAACSLLLAALLALWGAYAAAVRRGRELPSYRLALLCLSFAACSWGMNVLNKSLVVALGAPSLVTAAQMLMTVAGTVLFARDKIAGSWDEALKWCSVPMFFFGMLVSSLFTYEYMSLSLLTVVRNMGPLVTLPIERAMMPPEKQPSVSLEGVAALLLVLAGAVVYCRAVPGALPRVGFAFALLNMVLAIADRLLQRRLLTTECRGMSNEACVLQNNLLGLVPTLILGTALGEVGRFDAGTWLRSSATLLLPMSGLVGSGICYFAIAVQREISATSFMVLQNTVRLAVVCAGVAIFGDPLGGETQAVGLAMSFSGAMLYGKTQVDAAEEARRRAADGERRKLLPQ